MALCDGYYRREVAEGTAIPEPGRIAGGVYGLIEDEGGPVAVQDTIAAADKHQLRYEAQMR